MGVVAKSGWGLSEWRGVAKHRFSYLCEGRVVGCEEYGQEYMGLLERCPDWLVKIKWSHHLLRHHFFEQHHFFGPLMNLLV